MAPPAEDMDDDTLLDLHKRHKKESFDNRWIWERTWMRNLHYVNNRHWITYVQKSNEWRDVRLAKWVPKPVTNKVGEGTQALRAMLASVNIGVNVRPVGANPENVAVAAVGDELSPLLHEEHDMDAVMNEGDFWFIVCGNVFLHTYLERDIKHGSTEVPYEQCQMCQAVSPVDATTTDAGHTCPECGSPDLTPAIDPETGAPKVDYLPQGKGVTCALSPFELAFPNTYARFADVPYVIRLRWRSKDYYEHNPVLKPQVAHIKWGKAPSEQSLQLFRSLPFHSDLGVAPFLGVAGGASEELGISEYEHWIRPCDQYPKGLVFRVVGDNAPIILHLEEDEAIPGPLPYVDATGQPVFTFDHAAFEQRGGRVYGTSPLDSIIPKQNQLNQLDSMMQMIIQRTANPLWLVPKGAEIEKFTGEPGLVVKWNPLTVGGSAKPERLDGIGPGAWMFQVREMYLKDIEEGLGTYDIVKGSKPAGVEAFSAMQLLVERSQSRFATAFKARGNLYKSWYKFALELEREFGPDERTRNVLSPARTWTHKMFKNADLQGSFSVVVEDGSMTPKTTLGMRASIEHLNSLRFLDPNDPDQRYRVFQKFGQTDLAPSLDIHMQAALRKQQAFEEWAQNPEAQQQSMQQAQQAVMQYQQQVAAIPPPPEPTVAGPDGQPMPAPAPDPAAMLPPPPSPTKFTPLAWKPWFSAPIHKQEFLKWANSDKVIEMVSQNPALEALLVAHLTEMDGALAQIQMQQAQAQAGPPKPGGAGQAMSNSNHESGGSQNAGNHAAKPQGVS
jgi:hypothetical protein